LGEVKKRLDSAKAFNGIDEAEKVELEFSFKFCRFRSLVRLAPEQLEQQKEKE